MRPLFPAKFPKNDNKPGESLLVKQKKYYYYAHAIISTTRD